VQGWIESRQHVVAHRRGGREARLARSGIREHDAFLGHEMRGPAGTQVRLDKNLNFSDNLEHKKITLFREVCPYF